VTLCTSLVCRFRPDIVPVSATPPPAEWGAYRERATTAVGITITVSECLEC